MITRYIFFGATPALVPTSIGILVMWFVIGLASYFGAHAWGLKKHVPPVAAGLSQPGDIEGKTPSEGRTPDPVLLVAAGSPATEAAQVAIHS